MLQLLCAIPVLAAMALSATFAFEFGATKGATAAFAWLYGFAFAAFDVSKAIWPIQASRWSQQGNRAGQVACWLLFVLCTLWSLYSHFGITALQLASKSTNQTVAAKTQDSKQITLDRLRKQRDDIPRFTTTTREAVKTAEDAVTTAAEQAAAERTRGGCREFCRQREAEEREARAALKKAQEDKAATAAAKELDDRITLAEAAVATVDQTVVHQETDAQSGALATMLGLDKGRVSSAGQLGFAFILEVFSGLGLWALGFGHGERRRVEVAVEPLEPVIAADVEDAVTIETPADAAYRIFREIIRPDSDSRAPHSVVYGVYETICAEQCIKPVSSKKFGDVVGWPSDKIGGRVYFRAAALADRTRAPLRIVADNSNSRRRLGAMAKGTPTTH